MNTITARNETESLLHEKFQSLLDDLDTAGDNAEYGHVLDEMDDYLFIAIRQLAAETLEKKIQDRINAVEQTAEVKQCPHCKKNGSP
jgi:polyhydroxyalkanoate synthesis regulator phasin